jgi:hypothetical protein
MVGYPFPMVLLVKDDIMADKVDWSAYDKSLMKRGSTHFGCQTISWKRGMPNQMVSVAVNDAIQTLLLKLLPHEDPFLAKDFGIRKACYSPYSTSCLLILMLQIIQRYPGERRR